jgi:hypothetical protein
VRAVNERDLVPRSAPRKRVNDRRGWRGLQLAPVALDELAPPGWIVAEPAPQAVARGDLLVPVLDGQGLERHASRPQTIHQHAEAVALCGRLVRPLDAHTQASVSTTSTTARPSGSMTAARASGLSIRRLATFCKSQLPWSAHSPFANSIGARRGRHDQPGLPETGRCDRRIIDHRRRRLPNRVRSHFADCRARCHANTTQTGDVKQARVCRVRADEGSPVRRHSSQTGP